MVPDLVDPSPGKSRQPSHEKKTQVLDLVEPGPESGPPVVFLQADSGPGPQRSGSSVWWTLSQDLVEPVLTEDDVESGGENVPRAVEHVRHLVRCSCEIDILALMVLTFDILYCARMFVYVFFMLFGPWM